ncbi:MAG: hypothetical protein ABIK44_01980 [candidate division WOR-3 bacterium]
MRRLLISNLLMISLIFGAEILLGRCPVDNVTAIYSGRFFGFDNEDLLVVADVGELELTPGPARRVQRVSLRRLALLRFSASRFERVWLSEPLLGPGAAETGVSPSTWAFGDIDNDSKAELIIISGDSCRIFDFGPDSVTRDLVPFAGMWPEQAVCCDITNDSVPELVTVETSPFDTTGAARLFRVYRLVGPVLEPWSAYISGIAWGMGTRVLLTGVARLEDYDGELPVLVAIYPGVRPSSYAVLHEVRADSFAFTTNPFPWQPWFSKNRVLPMGELSLFNVGDTLVAYGYFVPGSRPSGPQKSFAALQDGEWRLLRLSDQASKLSGPVCRFTTSETSGWLELRDNIFHFYPGEIFHWR